MNIAKNVQLHCLEDAKKPKRSTKGSAGYDIFADKDYTLGAKTITKIDIPFTIEGDTEKYKFHIYMRSSFGIKKRIRLCEEQGKILPCCPIGRSMYVYNDSEQDVLIQKNEHFAQMVIEENHPRFYEMEIREIAHWAKQKQPPTLGTFIQEQEDYVFILGEDVTLEPCEQRALSTGFKAKIPEGTWFQIHIHPEVEKKLLLANGVAVIDKDYFENIENDGNCIIAIVNRTSDKLFLSKGTRLTSWRCLSYFVLDDEEQPQAIRTGGIGHTSKGK